MFMEETFEKTFFFPKGEGEHSPLLNPSPMMTINNFGVPQNDHTMYQPTTDFVSWATSNYLLVGKTDPMWDLFLIPIHD